MGKGYMSLKNQQECHVEHLKRFGKTAIKKTARRRLSIYENESKTPGKVVRNGYASVDFTPSVNVETDTSHWRRQKILYKNISKTKNG